MAMIMSRLPGGKRNSKHAIGPLASIIVGERAGYGLTLVIKDGSDRNFSVYLDREDAKAIAETLFDGVPRSRERGAGW
jgi:hypothetical protein